MSCLPRSRLMALAAAIGITITGLLQAAMAEEANAADLIVFAASSLKSGLDQVNEAWVKETGNRALISYAASSSLAKQIEQEAPADLFISADNDWMDYLADRNLLKRHTRVNLLGNQLVIVARKDWPGSITLAPGIDLAAVLGGERLAIADVASVPAGKYAKFALKSLGAWAGVAGKLAQTENVRAAMALVSRGEAPLGIVYLTDAAADSGVRIVATFPEDSHPPILYPVALTSKTNKPSAADFLEFLKAKAARRIFEAQGFSILK